MSGAAELHVSAKGVSLKNIFPEIVNEMLPNPLHKELRVGEIPRVPFEKRLKNTTGAC